MKEAKKISVNNKNNTQVTKYNLHDLHKNIFSCNDKFYPFTPQAWLTKPTPSTD